MAAEALTGDRGEKHAIDEENSNTCINKNSRITLHACILDSFVWRRKKIASIFPGYESFMAERPVLQDK